MRRYNKIGINKLLTPEIIRKRAYENKIKKVVENTRIKREKIDNMLQSCEDKFISKICELFINRWDCYAIQVNENPLLFPTVYQDLTLDIIKDSLDKYSKITIGIHQIYENKIKWICYDIDKKHTSNPKLLSDQIIKYLKEWYNLTGYLEPSGSHDSYHVWIFIEPTYTDIAINFHKTFKNELKSVGIDTKAIEKGISEGSKGLGCMIKLPFNIQRKSDKRSELLANIFNIVPEKIPVIQEPNIQKSNHADILNIGKCGSTVCYKASEGVNYDYFENVEICNEIISKIPKIANRLKLPEIDRSGLDFLIIKALSEVGISKDTIHKYLKTIPNSKIHERGDLYFQKSYNNVINATNIKFMMNK